MGRKANEFLIWNIQCREVEKLEFSSSIWDVAVFVPFGKP